MSSLLQRTAAALAEQDDLRYDYSQIAEEHRAAVRDAAVEIKRTMQRSAAVIGSALATAKARLNHGQWLAWLQAEFEWSERTAENAMNAARLVAKNEKFSVLGDSSQYLLGAPSTPEPARVQVLEMIDGGQGSGKEGRVTVRDVKRVISAHKPTVDLRVKRVVGKCSVCGRPLTDPNSVGKACGPACERKRLAQGEPEPEQPAMVEASASTVHVGRFVPATEPPTECTHERQMQIPAANNEFFGGMTVECKVLLCRDCGLFRVRAAGQTLIVFRLSSEAFEVVSRGHDG